MLVCMSFVMHGIECCIIHLFLKFIFFIIKIAAFVAL